MILNRWVKLFNSTKVKKTEVWEDANSKFKGFLKTENSVSNQKTLNIMALANRVQSALVVPKIPHCHSDCIQLHNEVR